MLFLVWIKLHWPCLQRRDHGVFRVGTLAKQEENSPGSCPRIQINCHPGQAAFGTAESNTVPLQSYPLMNRYAGLQRYDVPVIQSSFRFLWAHFPSAKVETWLNGRMI